MKWQDSTILASAMRGPDANMGGDNGFIGVWVLKQMTTAVLRHLTGFDYGDHRTPREAQALWDTLDAGVHRTVKALWGREDHFSIHVREAFVVLAEAPDGDEARAYWSWLCEKLENYIR